MKKHLNTYSDLKKTERFSTKPHFIFGGIIIVFLLLICLFFTNPLSHIFQEFPLFSFIVITLVITGIAYYFYKIMAFKSFSYLNKETSQDSALKITRIMNYYNILQILITIVGLTTVTISVLGILDIAKNNHNLFDNTVFLNNNNKFLIEPFYIIIISLTSISILFIISSRLKEIILQLHEIPNQVSLNRNITLNTTQSPMLNTGAHMSDNIADKPISKNIPTESDDNAPFTLPNYDNGFFYKKLFEINDNVLHLKRQFLFPSNDNITTTHIENLWNDKILPFLSTISDSVKSLETKLQSLEEKTLGTHKDNKASLSNNITPDTATIIRTDDVSTQDTSLKNADEIFNLTPENKIDNYIPEQDTHDIEDDIDKEEIFINTTSDTNQTIDTKNKKNLDTDIKEKKLEELRSLLEIQMQQFYNNQSVAKKSINTEKSV